MRSQQEMMGLILKIAIEDRRVRAVYMTGSRANPNVQKDCYQDYDVVYVVTETESFLADKPWIVRFGESAIVQEPDSGDMGWGSGHDCSRSYGWLMLFLDGTRVDLRILTREAMEEEYTSDTLSLPLLDKDGILPAIPAPNDSGYWIKKPEKERFDGCCNEFWWCLNNVAKGIKRGQLPYAMKMYTQTVHAELEKMVEWYVGVRTDFSVSTGMWGKYFKKYLPAELYRLYLKTYADGDAEHLWAAVFTACQLFRTTASAVAEGCGYTYNNRDDANMTSYLNSLQGVQPPSPAADTVSPAEVTTDCP